MENEYKLIQRITTCLEEYGMPEFRDRFPAMSVLQLLKDHGYVKCSTLINGGYFGTHCHIFHEAVNECGCGRNKLVPLDEEEVRYMIISETLKDIMNWGRLSKTICSKFGTPAIPSLEEIENIVHEYMTKPRTVEKTIKDFYTNCSKELSQAIHDLLTKGK